MKPRKQQPMSPTNPQALGTAIKRLRTGNYNIVGRPAEIQFRLQDEGIISCMPGLGLYNEDDQYYTIWINGNTYYIAADSLYSDDYGTKRHRVIDTQRRGYNTEEGWGGSLDNQVPDTTSGIDNFLIWAIANDANTAFETFGFTRRPQADFSAITNGGMNSSTATITMSGTGENQAYRYTVGAICTVRNWIGTLPNCQWNTGVILEIPDNQTLVLQLDNNSVNGSTSLNNAAGQVIQWNRYRCFNDNAAAGYDESAWQNARLLGEYNTWDINRVFGLRSIHDSRINIPYEEISDTYLYSAAGIYYVYYGRFTPPWTDVINFCIRCRCTSGTMTVAFSHISGKALYQEYFTGSETHYRCLETPLQANEEQIITIGLSGTGDMRLLRLTGYNAELRP